MDGGTEGGDDSPGIGPPGGRLRLRENRFSIAWGLARVRSSLATDAGRLGREGWDPWGAGGKRRGARACPPPAPSGGRTGRRRDRWRGGSGRGRAGRRG